MENENLANYTGLATLLLIPVAFVAPWLNAIQGINRPVLVWILAIAPVVTYLLSCLFMPSGMNIRVDLLIVPPALLLVLVNAALVTYRMKKQNAQDE